MKLTGTQKIALSRKQVWEGLNDPAILKASLPGCESLELSGENAFKAVVGVKIGPIGARFNGHVSLTDLQPELSYRLNGEGKGGMAGGAKGSAFVSLADDGTDTLLTYDIDAAVSGRLAQLGGPIIDATAKQLAAKFFRNFEEAMTGGVTAAVPVAAGTQKAGVALPSQKAQPRTASGGLPVIWLIALALGIIGGFALGKSGAADEWVIWMLLTTVVTGLAGYAHGRKGGITR